MSSDKQFPPSAKKLKKAELKVYKERLLAVRARLRGDVNAMASTALKTAGDGNSSSAPLHMADIGSENFEQEFTLSLMQSEEETLEMIEKALERVESGEYGLCVECAGTIPKMRLNAVPHTSHCVKCAAISQGCRTVKTTWRLNAKSAPAVSRSRRRILP